MNNRFLHITLFLCMLSPMAWSQQEGNIHVSGDEITVPTGEKVYIKGSYEDHLGDTLANGQPAEGSLANGDTIRIGRNIINNSPYQLHITQDGELSEGTIEIDGDTLQYINCLLYTSPSPRDS